METESRLLTVGGQTTRVLELGMGHPVVVLHGWGGRIESMTPVLRCLEQTFKVVALDLPGFGEAPVPSGAWATADYAEYVADVVKHLGIARAHFVGHSFGAKTAFYLAATHHEAVDKLVLVASSGLRKPPSLEARAKRALSKGARVVGRLGAPGRRIKDATYRRIASRDYQEAGPLRAILVNVVNEDLSHLLEQITAPTLLVWGTDDDAVPVSHGRMMERSIPDAGLVLFDGCGHFPYLDQPDRFCRVVRHYFGSPVRS